MLKSCSNTCLMSVPNNESKPSSVNVDVPKTFLTSLIPKILAMASAGPTDTDSRLAIFFSTRTELDSTACG
ncbi:hypothetical protein FWK35_00002577 [Aphis craccivora]|uniref:Uncharacterized protein n=1 Tax=Aphis craccivora TaxID=307492 RepID=A0A6G0ZFX6_APHCR|nr:hypothetical protein FWK35_00002577 [Aphis craccivora]